MNNGNGTLEKMRELDRMIGELAGLRQQISTCLVDVQESHRADEDVEALRESERRTRDWLDHLPQRIYVKDRNLVYQWCNQTYARDLQITPEEIIGKKDHDFYPPELAEKYEGDDEKALATGEKQEAEDRIILWGEERTILSARVPLPDENGTLTGILGTFWDISERKKAEEEPKKYIERLKKLVFERGTQIESLNDHLQKEIAERKRLEGELNRLRASGDGGKSRNPAPLEAAS